MLYCIVFALALGLSALQLFHKCSTAQFTVVMKWHVFCWNMNQYCQTIITASCDSFHCGFVFVIYFISIAGLYNWSTSDSLTPVVIAITCVFVSHYWLLYIVCLINLLYRLCVTLTIFKINAKQTNFILLECWSLQISNLNLANALICTKRPHQINHFI